MNAHPFLVGLRQGPDFLLQDLDLVNRRGLVVRISEADYRRASFLDHRVLKPDTRGNWFPLDMLQHEVAELPPPAAPHFIFHVSHCGSTLVSRLLAELPGNLPLREPVTLLALSQSRRELGLVTSRLDAPGWDRLADLVMSLLARSYAKDQRVLLKATSACANLLTPLLSRQAESRALMLYTDLETWLTVMLRKEGVRENGRFYAAAWFADFCELTGRRDLKLSALGDAEQFAINWLMGMLHFQRAREQLGERVQLMGFEDFLAEPAARLADAARLFGLDTAGAAQAVAGPLMKSYGKNPNIPFDAAERQRELEEGRRVAGNEIRAGLAFAERICNEVAMLAPVTPRLRRGP